MALPKPTEEFDELPVELRLYTMDEVCAILRTGRTKLSGIVNRGEMASYWDGGRRLIPHADLCAYIQCHRRPALLNQVDE